MVVVVLKKTVFANYDYPNEQPSLYKFNLADFSALSVLFPNNKQTLNLSITNQSLVLEASSSPG